MRNVKFWCSQRKFDWLRFPKPAYVCGSSWDFNSSVSKTTDWTSSIKFSMGNFICVSGYSINLFRNMFPAFVLSWAEIGKEVFWCGFSVKSNSFSLKVLSERPLSRSQESVKFSEGDSEKYLGLCTLLRSTDKSIMVELWKTFENWMQNANSVFYYMQSWSKI